MSPQRLAALIDEYRLSSRLGDEMGARAALIQGVQRASNEEPTRRREYIASMEAAMKRIAANKPKGEQPTWDDALSQDTYDDAASKGYDCAAWDLALIAEAALSGGTAALDAVVAEATRELREERDEWLTKAMDVENHPVVKVLREERDALAAEIEKLPHQAHCEVFVEKWLHNAWKSAYGDKLPVCTCNLCDLKTASAVAILAARDARVRAEAAAAELSDAADEMEARRLQGIGFTASDLRARAAELRKLAAQAGEVGDAEN